MSQFSLQKRALIGVVSLIGAAVIWLPSMHFFYREDLSRYFNDRGISPKAHLLASRFIKIWTDPEAKKIEISNIRASNPEWDFMWRSFFVWSLANMGLKESGFKKEALPIMDGIIQDTILRIDREGIRWYLMDYAKERDFVLKPEASLFLDGEIALMLGSRRLLEEKEEYKIMQTKLVARILERMNRGPVLSAESYPDECWIFCNAVSLVAIKISDFLDGTDHSEFFQRWIAMAKKQLVHRETGLLISSYALSGSPIDGPEGSTIWMVAHCLRFIDQGFALDQYRRAKKELGRNVLGFGYAREWPSAYRGGTDIDSGGVMSALDVSPSSSGFALLAAHSFRDDDFASTIIASLNLAGFAIETKGTLKYATSNMVGDAVLLYAMVSGPVWEKVCGAKKHG